MAPLLGIHSLKQMAGARGESMGAWDDGVQQWGRMWSRNPMPFSIQMASLCVASLTFSKG